MLRRTLLSAGLALAVLASACGTMPKTQVLADRAVGKPVPLGKVLVVVDYSLQVSAFPASKGIDERMAKWHLPVGEVMSDAVKAAGGTPVVAYVGHSDQQPTVAPEYSHVWVLRITGMTIVTQYGAPVGAKDRQWHASIAHRTSPNEPVSVGYTMDYVSDADQCFHAAERFAPRAECVDNYRGLIAGQLRAYQAGS